MKASTTSSLVGGGNRGVLNVVGVCVFAGQHLFCLMKRDFLRNVNFCTKIVYFMHVLRQDKAWWQV